MTYNEIETNFREAAVFSSETVKTLLEQKLKDDDARVIFFEKICEINTTSTIIYSLYCDQLLTYKWWNKFPNNNISSKSKDKFCDLVDKHIRITFMIQNFSALESSLRIIMSAYDSKKYLKTQNSFKQLIKWFMQEMELEDIYPLIQIFINLRNSIHSNGLFDPLDHKDMTIRYDNKIFSFKVGKLIEYASWHHLFSITKIAITNIKQIVNNPKIKQIVYIKDPSYHAYRLSQNSGLSSSLNQF